MMTSGNKKEPSTDVFTIDIVRLKDSVNFSRDIPLLWLEARLSDCEYEVEPIDGSIEFEIEPVNNGVLVDGEVDVNIETNCGICLAKTTLHLTASARTCLQPKPDDEENEEESEKEMTVEELDVECYQDNLVVLDEFIGDTIMLEMPMTPTCGDNCPGLNGARSIELKPKIDPRLAPLANIKIEKEN
jgi:DUF177 domain-containing protein